MTLNITITSVVSLVSLFSAILILQYLCKSQNKTYFNSIILFISISQMTVYYFKKKFTKPTVKKVCVGAFIAVLEFLVFYSMTKLLKHNSLPVFVTTPSALIFLLSFYEYVDFSIWSVFGSVGIFLSIALSFILELYEKTWVPVTINNIEHIFLDETNMYLYLFVLGFVFRVILHIYKEKVKLFQECELFGSVFLFVSGLVFLLFNFDSFLSEIKTCKDIHWIYLLGLVLLLVFVNTCNRKNHTENYALAVVFVMLVLHFCYLIPFLNNFFIKTLIEKELNEIYIIMLAVHFISIGGIFEKKFKRRNRLRRRQEIIRRREERIATAMGAENSQPLA
ncbi:hypothetical protein GVAV_003505 [Gurleya vavrai]